MKHELWEEGDGSGYTFCLADPIGDAARKSLGAGAKLIWTVEANSHYEAMNAYYEYMGWGTYQSEFEEDKLPYPEEWSAM